MNGAARLLKSKVTAKRSPIPALIKRNTILLAAAQAFVGTGTQLGPTLGAIVVVRLLGSATFAGLATSTQSLSRFLIAYPIGWVADTHGRRVALLIGQALCLVGALCIGAAVILSSFPLFIVGILIFGLGIGAGQQLRLAAADLYPPARRAEGLGLVLSGSLVGAFGGPVLISIAQRIAPSLSIDPIAMAWLLVPAVLIPSMGLVFLIRPDPREIATNIRQYYPAEEFASSGRRGDGRTFTGVQAWITHYPLLTAFVASFAAQGNMALMMAMTSLALAHHGHDLPVISLAVAIHVVGMFGLSLPVGRISDRFGRRKAMLLGCILAAIGAGLVGLTTDYWPITLGTFLVGLGWSCINVSASALIADLTPPRDRGRAVGTNDTFSGAGAILLPLLGGPLVEAAGLPILAIIGAGLMLIPFVMIFGLREVSPGHFVESAD